MTTPPTPGQTPDCTHIKPFLSALVDGELKPLESIGVRRHVERCASCRMELMSIEQLKLKVHDAGRDDRLLPSGLDRARWAGAIASLAEVQRERMTPYWRLPLAAAAAVVIGLLSLSVPSAYEAKPVAVGAVAQAPVSLDQDALSRLVSVHTGKMRHISLDDLVQAGALMTFEELPGTFIPPNSGGANVVQASFADCDPGSTVGSTLAVFRAARVSLTPEAQSALDTSGVFVEVIGHTEVRLTRGGDRLFVLLRPIEPVSVGI